MRDLRIPIRIVFYREDNRWMAHCLEFDLLGDGTTREQALECLSGAIVAQIATSIEHNNPANLFSPAEGKYFQMFAEGKSPRAEGDLSFHLQVPSAPHVVIEEPEFREYDNSDLAFA